MASQRASEAGGVPALADEGAEAGKQVGDRVDGGDGGEHEAFRDNGRVTVLPSRVRPEPAR